MRKFLFLAAMAGCIYLMTTGCTKDTDQPNILLLENKAMALLSSYVYTTPDDSVYLDISVRQAEEMGIQMEYYNKMATEISKINQSILKTKKTSRIIVNCFKKKGEITELTKAGGGGPGSGNIGEGLVFGPYTVSAGASHNGFRLSNSDLYPIAWCSMTSTSHPVYNPMTGRYEMVYTPFHISIYCENNGEWHDFYGISSENSGSSYKFRTLSFSEIQAPWSFAVEAHQGAATIYFTLYEGEEPQ